MRTIVLVMLVAASSAAAALAEPAGRQKPDYSTPRSKVLPVVKKGASAGHSCARFGPGFVKVEGTGTCVKVGGAVSIGVGGAVPH